MPKITLALATEFLPLEQNAYRRNLELLNPDPSHFSYFLCPRHKRSSCHECTALPRTVVCCASAQMTCGILPYVLSSPTAYRTHALSIEEFALYKKHCPTLWAVTRLNIGWQLQSFDELMSVLGAQDFVIGIRLSAGIAYGGRGWLGVDNDDSDDDGESAVEQERQQEEEKEGAETTETEEAEAKSGFERLVDLVLSLPFLKTFEIDGAADLWKHVPLSCAARLLMARQEPIRVYVAQSLRSTYFAAFSAQTSMALDFKAIFDTLIDLTAASGGASLEALCAYISCASSLLRPVLAAQASQADNANDDNDDDDGILDIGYAVRSVASALTPLLRRNINVLRKVQAPGQSHLSLAQETALLRVGLMFCQAVINEYLVDNSDPAAAVLIVLQTLAPSGLLHVVCELCLLRFLLSPEVAPASSSFSIPPEFIFVLASGKEKHSNLLDAVFATRELAARLIETLATLSAAQGIDVKALLFSCFRGTASAKDAGGNNSNTTNNFVAGDVILPKQHPNGACIDNTENIAGLVAEITFRHVENPVVLVRSSDLWRKRLLLHVIAASPLETFPHLFALAGLVRAAHTMHELRVIKCGDVNMLSTHELLGHETLRDDPVCLIKSAQFFTALFRVGSDIPVVTSMMSDSDNDDIFFIAQRHHSDSYRKKLRKSVYDIIWPRLFGTNERNSVNLLPVLRSIILVSAVQLGGKKKDGNDSDRKKSTGAALAPAAVGAATSPANTISPIHRRVNEKDAKASFVARLEARVRSLPPLANGFVGEFLTDLKCGLRLEKEFGDFAKSQAAFSAKEVASAFAATENRSRGAFLGISSLLAADEEVAAALEFLDNAWL